MTDDRLEDTGMHTEEPNEWGFDPVCGMEVELNSTKLTSEHQGKTYYFCNNSCLQHFEANPEQYAS